MLIHASRSWKSSRMPRNTTRPARRRAREKRDSRNGGPGFHQRHGHLPFVHAGRPLRIAAQDPADQFLRVRLRLLHQPPLEQRAPRAFLRPGGGRLSRSNFYRRNYIEGLFLSSGIIRSPDYTMELLVRVARTLRKEHGFRGYIHLKSIPDAAPELISEAGLLRRPALDQYRVADRIRSAGVRAGEAHRHHPRHDGATAAARSTRPKPKRKRRALRPPARARR